MPSNKESRDEELEEIRLLRLLDNPLIISRIVSLASEVAKAEARSPDMKQIIRLAVKEIVKDYTAVIAFASVIIFSMAGYFFTENVSALNRLVNTSNQLTSSMSSVERSLEFLTKQAENNRDGIQRLEERTFRGR